jgi:hypothetical protein
VIAITDFVGSCFDTASEGDHSMSTQPAVVSTRDDFPAFPIKEPEQPEFSIRNILVAFDFLTQHGLHCGLPDE